MAKGDTFHVVSGRQPPKKRADQNEVVIFGYDDINDVIRRIRVDELGQLQIDVVVGSVTLDSFSSATNSKISVGTSSTSVLSAAAGRKWASIVNDSDNVVYLSLGGTAVLNEGIRLNSNGGSFVISATNLYTGAVNAIATVAGSNVTITYA